MTKAINQPSGALCFTLKGENKILLNWDEGMMQVWNNGKKEFIINMDERKIIKILRKADSEILEVIRNEST